MKLRAGRFVLSFTNVLWPSAEILSGSLVMGMFGLCYKQEEGVLESGLTASACYVVPSEDVCVACGMPKTIHGLRSIRTTKKDGFMSTHVKNHGITLGCIPKVSNHNHFHGLSP